MTINLWELTYDRKTGVLDKMSLLANTTDSDLELQIESKKSKSDDGFLISTSFYFIIPVMALMVFMRKYAKLM